MKKFVFAIIILILILLVPKTSANEIHIPKDSIRIRVIANSNSDEDQKIKSIVRKNLEKSIFSLLKDTNNTEQARNKINKNLPLISSNLEKILIDNNVSTVYTVKFGHNYFPEKTYKGVKYEAGMYESLVITLGNGKGNNWWCVLFPPLCLMEAKENDNIEDVEYQFFIKKIIDKYMK